MKRSIALLPVVLAVACGDETTSAEPLMVAPPEPELVCPLTELPDADPGPLPEHDPARAQALPALSACGIPGRTVQRLNRTAYNNAVRDLFLVDVRPADAFPVDDTADGYDNQGAVLAIAPVLVEKYLAAAHAVVDAALDPGLPPVERRIWEAEVVFGDNPEDTTVHVVQRESGRGVTFTLPEAGTYRFHVRAYGEQAGGEPVQMSTRLDDVPLAMFDVEAVEDEPATYTTTTFVDKGSHTFMVRYLNDYQRARNNDDPGLDRNLVLDYIEIEGPFDVAPDAPPRARQALLTCDPAVVGPEACADEILTRTARRAFRRAPTALETTRLRGVFQLARAGGASFEEALKAGLRTILMSPAFLFLVEEDPDPTSAAPHLLTNHDLASRLAMYLWSSIPDERLLTLAERGALQDPVVLESEVRRMLLDKRSRAFVESFAGQWLQSRAVDELIVDGEKNPGVDHLVLRSMRCETELVFDELLRSDAPIKDLLLGDFTYVNGPLARHYAMDVPAVEARPGAHPESGFARITLDEESPRTGILTQGGILALGSHPLRTSPVRRGKYVLDQLLCIPPDPPPGNVEGLPTEAPEATTLRELMEEHRANPVCASCHVMMDPIGLGLEHFDELGRFRNKDNGMDIDASELFMGITPFDGSKELAHVIADTPEFPTCVTEKAMVYALGRSFTDEDRCARDAIVADLVDEGLPLSEIVVRIALTPQFRMRRATPEDHDATDPGDVVDTAPGGTP